MAKRKKRSTVRKGKSTGRGRTRKASKSARAKTAKRTVAKYKELFYPYGKTYAQTIGEED